MDSSDSNATDHNTMKESRYLNRSSWQVVWKSSPSVLLPLLKLSLGGVENVLGGFVVGDEVMRLVRLLRLRLMEVESQKDPRVMERAASLETKEQSRVVVV